MYDNTLIIFTTDHGDYLGNHGYVYKGFPAFEEVYNAPLIIKNIDSKNKNTKTDCLFSHVDIPATILDYANAKPIKDQDGISMMDFLNDTSLNTRDFAIIENRPVEKNFYQKMIVTNDYKLVAYMNSEDGELYNLIKDPNQYNNLWNKDEFSSIKIELLQQICNYYQEKKTESNSCFELLKIISHQMNSETNVQKRTSYS